MPIGAIPKDQFSSIKATTDQTSTENSSSVSRVDNVTEEISKLSIHENQHFAGCLVNLVFFNNY